MNVFDRTLVLAVLIVLAVGMGSAAVLSNYGVISGTADVEGPTFYAENNNELLINTQPSNGNSYKIDGQDIVFFNNADLESAEWYDADLDFFVRAKLDDGSDEGNMDVRLRYTNSSGTYTVCSTVIRVDKSDYSVYQSSCQGDITGNVTGFYYELIGSPAKTFRVAPNGETRVEVNAQ